MRHFDCTSWLQNKLEYTIMQACDSFIYIWQICSNVDPCCVYGAVVENFWTSSSESQVPPSLLDPVQSRLFLPSTLTLNTNPTYLLSWIINMPLYVCNCEQASCRTAQHTVEGVGVLPGRVLSRQVYQDHQRKESQRCARERAQLEKPEGKLDAIQVSYYVCMSNSHILLLCLTHSLISCLRQTQPQIQEPWTVRLS